MEPSRSASLCLCLVFGAEKASLPTVDLVTPCNPQGDAANRLLNLAPENAQGIQV